MLTVKRLFLQNCLRFELKRGSEKMPAVCIRYEGFNGHIKEILNSLPELPAHNWLITDLECYDYCGWDGCDKWANEKLFLTDEELRHDVNLRDMQFVWGVFSALPLNVSEKDALEYPDVGINCNWNFFMNKNTLLPQHPNSILEIWSEDSTSVTVVAHNPDYLKPLYNLDCEVRDEELYNQKMNSELCRIRNALKIINPDIPENKASAVQWSCWRKLFLNSDKQYDDDTVVENIKQSLEYIEKNGFYDSGFYWSPFDA